MLCSPPHRSLPRCGLSPSVSRGGCGVGAGRWEPGGGGQSARMAPGQRGERVRGHVCGRRGHVRGQGGRAEPAGRWSLTDEEVALALPAVPQPVDKRVPDLSLGTQKHKRVSGPRGWGPRFCHLPSAAPTASWCPRGHPKPLHGLGSLLGRPLTWMLTSSLHCLRVSRRSTSTLGTTWGGARHCQVGGQGQVGAPMGPRSQHPPSRRRPSPSHSPAL